jgi:hypothetical protein
MSEQYYVGNFIVFQLSIFRFYKFNTLCISVICSLLSSRGIMSNNEIDGALTLFDLSNLSRIILSTVLYFNALPAIYHHDDFRNCSSLAMQFVSLFYLCIISTRMIILVYKDVSLLVYIIWSKSVVTEWNKCRENEILFPSLLLSCNFHVFNAFEGSRFFFRCFPFTLNVIIVKVSTTQVQYIVISWI